MIPIGHKQVDSGGGVAITSSGGGGYTVNMVGSQRLPRYRLTLSANIQNLTNRANYVGYSGVMTSKLFLQPTNVSGTRRINFNANLSF
jgi:outer membrane receptor protein involved in Fe transport